MWYAMQVISGQENRTILLTEKMVPKMILEHSFVPRRRIRKKFHGVWHEITEKLFPGYVFMISDQPQLLYEKLKMIPALTKMLGRCEEYFTPLSKTDIQMIKKLWNETEDCEVQISKIMVEEGNEIRILSGPLSNLEGQIKKVNLHKRTAAVEMEFMGNKSMVYLGIELVGKKNEKES